MTDAHTAVSVRHPHTYITRSTKVQTLGVPVRFMTEVLRKWNSTVQV
jgi:hypothetical protein